MGIANNDQVNYFKDSQLDIMSALCAKSAHVLTLCAGMLMMMSQAFQELSKARGALSAGRIPLSFAELLDHVQSKLGNDLADVMSKGHIKQFEVGKLWLQFRNLNDEMEVMWKRTELSELLSSLYHTQFSVRVGHKKNY